MWWTWRKLGRVLINAQIGVRFRGKSGKHLLVLSLTGFDPKQTSSGSVPLNAVRSSAVW